MLDGGLRGEETRLGKLEIAVFPCIFSSIIVALCLLLYNKNFFNVGDGINEYLPFFTQMGRIWSSGHFPFLTDNMFIGGNAVVELSHCVFAPQSILASLLAWHCEYKQVAAVFLAFFNMVLIGASCLVIGNQFHIRRNYSYLFSIFCLIQPLFLFICCRGWYNVGIAQGWWAAAIATFLLLAKQVSIRNFLLNFFSVLFLLVTCWTYAVLAYAVFALLFLIFHHKKPLLSSSLALLLLANILALLFSVPVYSEYLYNSDLHTRFFNFNNHGNVLVFPWSGELLSFWPTYLDFFHWFWGYRFFPLPLAFSTVFLPLIFFNRNINLFYRTNVEVRFIASLILVYFICTQLPSVMSSMRWPFRYLPFLAFSLCFLTSYALDQAEKKDTGTLKYFIFVGVCYVLSVSKSIGIRPKAMIMQLVSVILLVFLYFIDRKNIRITPPLSIIIAIIIFLIFSYNINWTKGRYMIEYPLYRSFELPEDFNRDGYTFTLGILLGKRLKPYASLSFHRSGLYNVRTINGYTPLGYKNWKTSGILEYDPQTTLDAMLVPVEGADMCRANAWRISTFVLPADVAQKNLARLEECGYHLGADAGAEHMTYASLPFDMTKGWEKLPPVALPPLEGVIHESHRDTLDIVSLPSREAPTRLVFPRLYWHGYRATLNGRELEITPDESGFLTSVTVPPGAAGTLEFSFFPKTWRYVWVCPLFSLIGALLCCLYARRWRPCGIWSPPARPKP